MHPNNFIIIEITAQRIVQLFLEVYNIYHECMKNSNYIEIEMSGSDFTDKEIFSCTNCKVVEACYIVSKVAIEISLPCNLTNKESEGQGRSTYSREPLFDIMASEVAAYPGKGAY